MKWNKYGFLTHYKYVKAEGTSPERLLNTCLIKGIFVDDVNYISETKIILRIKAGDLKRLKEAAGGRYNLEVIRQGGNLYKIKKVTANKALVVGLVVFAGILFYQSLFISQIEVSGYEAIPEQTIRASLREAGFYEGCRKSVSLDKVKLHIYEEFDNISWIGIKYRGNLAQVSIAENDVIYEKNTVSDDLPCNIVADQNGYIESVDPEQGMRAVEEGQYVKAGDVLISGVIPLEKTTYEENEDEPQESYVHAAGTVKAKIPVRLNFYLQSYELTGMETGRKMITVSVNDYEIMGQLCNYENAKTDRSVICDFYKPFKLKICVNFINEIAVEKKKISQKSAEKAVINEIHKYVKEKLPDNTQILNKSLNFTQEKNIIRVGVTLETLQKIGIEEEIVVDKSNRQSDQNDDQ